MSLRIFKLTILLDTGETIACVDTGKLGPEVQDRHLVEMLEIVRTNEHTGWRVLDCKVYSSHEQLRVPDWALPFLWKEQRA